MAEGVPTKIRGDEDQDLVASEEVLTRPVPTALLVRVLSMINGSYCRRRRRLTILEPDEMKFGVSLTLLIL